MKGPEYVAWQRQFTGFLAEAGFMEPHITPAQRLLALEQCVTRASFVEIETIRLSLLTAHRISTQSLTLLQPHVEQIPMSDLLERFSDSVFNMMGKVSDNISYSSDILLQPVIFVSGSVPHLKLQP